VVLGTTDVSKDLVKDISIWTRGLLAPPLFFIPWSTAAKAFRARKRIDQQLLELLTKDTQNQNSNGLLSRLLHARDEDNDASLTQEEVVDNLFTLIFAGSDTTSAAASVWLALSQQPQLKKELKDHPERLDAFVDQILEAYPPAPFSFRETIDELHPFPPTGWSPMDLRPPWKTPHLRRRRSWEMTISPMVLHRPLWPLDKARGGAQDGTWLVVNSKSSPKLWSK
jgi:hypothetical protein